MCRAPTTAVQATMVRARSARVLERFAQGAAGMEPDGPIVGRYAEVAGTVTVGPPSIQSGLPIAITVSPIANSSKSPSDNARRYFSSIPNMARKVGKEIFAHNCPPERAPVRQCDPELFMTLHHMIIRQDVARSVHDHPGAQARLASGSF